MSTYPVHLQVVRPQRFTRLQHAIRVLAFVALGVLGISFGALFLAAYLGLPAFVASRLAGQRAAPAEPGDAPRLTRLLHWMAAVSAWTGLTAEHLPARSPEETVRFEIEGQTHPTPASALWRVLTGLPSALVLAVLGCLGGLVWLWAALSVLITERVGDGAHHYLEGLQRWSVRLLAYQASLVDEYPPFSFADAPPHLPPARVAP
ncbi:MAG: DUF4389 domain-containing protein [Kofleriaceae bacterium]|nr:DUF4389 domain-containing protein [Kofleriaceae bacterium]MCL4226319.1 DUF4389 domain-containing protein [Myxococcales bacterium]